jgi:serine/threonine-protein kinase
MPENTSFESEPDVPLDAAGRTAELLVGRTLGGRWTLETLLGVGGSASVFAARHRNGRRAAVKVAHAYHVQHTRLRQRFLSEGYVANRLAHPGAVAILDDGEERDGTVFLVMELLTGRSLAQRLESDGPLPEADVIAIGAQVLDVLAAAHDRDILHRDIKPSNIFLTDGGTIKVLDFGSARLRESNSLVTRSGTVVGTPAFMAPELAAGNVDLLDPRTEVWAVGATLFQLLSGSTVHVARTANEAIVAAATRPARLLADASDRVSPQLAAVVDRALSFKQEDRWPNARAMKAALLELSGVTAPSFADFSSIDATVPEPLRAAPRPGLRKPGLIAAAIVIGLAALAALARERSRYDDVGAKPGVLNPSPTPASSVAVAPPAPATAIASASTIDLPPSPAAHPTTQHHVAPAGTGAKPRKSLDRQWPDDDVLDRRQ